MAAGAAGHIPTVNAIALTVGEVLLASTHDVADPIQRIGFASAVSVDVVLGATPDVIDGVGASLTT